MGEEMDFGWALSEMLVGRCVRRLGWNGKGMWIAVQDATTDSHMSQPYIYMKTAAGDLVPWTATQTDLLAEDWVKV